jgi:uncharacterized membrane-anchored protein
MNQSEEQGATLTIAGVVVAVFWLVAVVQALIYAPRALKAARRERREP